MAAAVGVLLYGFASLAVAVVLFVITPGLMRRYLQARERTDGVGRLVRILTWGATTNEKVVVVAVRVVLAIFIVLAGLAMAHAIGLKTWIFDT